MPGLIEKRYNLHRQLIDQKSTNSELESRLGQLQALSNLGMVSAMIAHEINNILTPLGNYAQLAQMYPDDAELHKKVIDKTIKNSQRAGKILQSMLAMAHGREHDRKKCLLRGMVDEIFTCLARDFSKDKINVTVEIGADVSVWAESVSFQQVLMNLILNARQALLGKGGSLKITAEQTNESTVVEVADSGCGIAAENMNDIFEPFFTTKTGDDKSEHLGAGLGLAFCKKIVESQGGCISVRSEVGNGSTFRLIMPIRPVDPANP